MKNILVTGIFFIFFTIASSQNLKRGLAYGHHSPDDLSVLSPGVSWWYNWDVIPESTVSSVYEDYGFEFVPMAWNGNFDQNALRLFLDTHSGVKYILAYNEPNFLSQANMTPTQAAEQWPLIEAIADEYNLKIVGPAVNYCGSCVSEGGVTYNDPFVYLDDFFDACPDCRVDYIAVHCYMNTVSALQWYIGEFKKYGKPIWLTEFAGWESNGNINNVNDQINYLIGAVDFLEYDTSVFRYSWFIGRGSGAATYPYIDVLGADGVLTPLGEVYVNMPVHDSSHYFTIPGRIEAESYTDMKGILLEKTTDVSGFANVGYIEAGDWLEYNTDIEDESDYYISFRVASTAVSGLKVLLDEEEILTQSFENTYGWQNWQTFFSTVHLKSGRHKIKIIAQTAGFNINWIEISSEKPSALRMHTETDEAVFFPNPSKGKVYFRNQHFTGVKVTDLTGRTVATFYGAGFIDISNLDDGIYFLNFSGEENRTEKLILKK